MKKLLLSLSVLFLSALTTHAQTDVTSTYIKNADFSSLDGWTTNKSAQFTNEGNGLIGTYNVRNQDGQVSTTDDTHTAEMYCIAVEARWIANYSSFQQSVTLPKGDYVISYDVENRNTKAVKNNYVNYFYVSDGTNTYSDESTEWMSGATTWVSHSITFSLTAETSVTFSLGYGLPTSYDNSLYNSSQNQNHHPDYTPVLYISNLKLLKYEFEVAALQTAIATATELNNKVTNGVKSLTDAITKANEVLTSPESQDAINSATTTLTAATTAAESIVTARLRAAGEYKKYTALNKVIGNESQTAAITALNTVAENNEATVNDVTNAETAVTLLKGYTMLTIKNGTFDENINIAADGTNSGTYLDVCPPKDVTHQTLYNVQAWTWDGTFAATASHAATAVYGANSSSTLGTGSTNSPTTDMFGASEGGTLQMSSGWGDMVRYTQDVELPAGQYVFYYEAYNANTATGLDANYFGIRNLSAVPSNVTATSGDPSAKQGTGDIIYANENTKTFASGEWTPSAMAFTLAQNEDSAKVAIGLIGGNTSQGSGKAAKLWVDNVEVYYIPATMETYTRPATSSGYGTICLPYAAQAADNVTVYEIAGVNSTENPTTLYLSTVSSMEAGKPYIYYAANNGTAADAVFTQTNTEKVTEPVAGANNLKGVFTSTQGGVVDGSYILYVDKWYKVTNSAVFNLGDNRAYISSFEDMPVATADKDASVKAMNVNNDATGINAIENASTIENGTIYTLSGQRVSNLTKGGIYIVNGKKVFVK